jgi:hypothetical protein
MALPSSTILILAAISAIMQPIMMTLFKLQSSDDSLLEKIRLDSLSMNGLAHFADCIQHLTDNYLH